MWYNTIKTVEKVIVAIDLFGQPADHIELRNIANPYGMKILEDGAQGLRSLSVHWKGNGKYDNIRIGVNSRLDTIQTAILLIKLEAFKKYEMCYKKF